MKKLQTCISFNWSCLFLAIWIPFIYGCKQTQHSKEKTESSFKAFDIPADWTQYEMDRSYKLSIPPTMELRHDYDAYTRWLSDGLGYITSADVVFQQKDLSTLSSDAKETYARILVQCYSMAPGETDHYNEDPTLTNEDYESLDEMVEAESAPGKLIGRPSWKIINIQDAKAIEGTYSRTGFDGPVNCRFYLLSNYDKMVKMIIAYRERDKNVWEENLYRVIYTFEWKNPQ